MTSSTLKKALQGEEYSLVLMTESIQNGEITKQDSEAIRRARRSNPHREYLYACLELWIDNEPDKARARLDALKEKGGFALNLLASLIYTEWVASVEKNNLQILQFWVSASAMMANLGFTATSTEGSVSELINGANQSQMSSNHLINLTQQMDMTLNNAMRLNNPLAMLNYLCTSKQSTINLVTYSPLIYRRLSPFYQQQLLRLIQQQYNQLTEAHDFYQFARCFEKMGLFADMSAAFHKAIACEPQGYYQHKLVKALQRQANKDQWGLFKTPLDYSYLNKKLSSLKATLTAVDKAIALCQLGEDKELAKLKTKLQNLSIELNNYHYVYRENSPAFTPVQQDLLFQKLNQITEFYEKLVPSYQRPSSMDTPSFDLK